MRHVDSPERGRTIFCVMCTRERVSYSQGQWACGRCVSQVLSLVFPADVKVNGNRVLVGFRYKSMIRSLILRAKVENSVLALTLLLSLLRDVLGDNYRHYNSPTCLVIAAPSSLRSRIYGRFNVAEAIRVSLFPRAKFLANPLPGSFWRFKRAGRNGRFGRMSLAARAEGIAKSIKYYIKFVANDKKANDIRAQITSSQCILVVDDVLTTGFTMGTLFDQLKMLGAQRIEGLVVASHSNQLAEL